MTGVAKVFPEVCPECTRAYTRGVPGVYNAHQCGQFPWQEASLLAEQDGAVSSFSGVCGDGVLGGGGEITHTR